MFCKILVAVWLFAACVSYCTADPVYVQRSYPKPLGACDKVDIVESTHGGIHTWDCFRNFTLDNRTVVNADFYLLRMNGTDADSYYVVNEDGSHTRRTATLKKINNITIYTEFLRFGKPHRDIIWCATDMLNPDSETLANLNKECNFYGMQNNNNTNCANY